MDILVLGGFGFIGRHVAAALHARGHRVVVGSRTVRRRPGPDVRRARFEELVTAHAWVPLLADVDVVVNCVGILRERPGESYDAIHHRAPAALSDACSAVGVRHLVHVSALGLGHASRHGFLTSKRAGECALACRPLPTTIVRPSLLDGEGGFGARWLRALARLPVHMVPVDAVGTIAALHVEDLGLAIARLCEEAPPCALREVGLGGPDERTLAGHLAALRGRPAVTIRVPAALARIGAWLCDAAHVSPYSLGHLELLHGDNVPRINRLPELLGRAPRRIGADVVADEVRHALPSRPTHV